MRILLCHIVIFTILIPTTISLLITFKSINCNASNLTINSNYSCKIRPIKRNVAALFVLVYVSRNTSNINVDILLTFRQKTSLYYRTLFNVSVNLCDFMSGKDNSIIMQFVKEILTKFGADNLFHPCPYLGEVNASNITLDKDNTLKIRSFKPPDGFYRVQGRFYGPKDSNMFTISVVVEASDKQEKNI
ncbi:hypothetical protein PVAND_012787 [Polypedilum vanderplanki]|uniref:Uncharacterized protein n=1 Tax=Polypedilum vanderplanki TaxID=319348 RepID=A0A9J6CMP8_POLVA|nr:hypothetical protein PVAND_012787 [Polypedilum vanderplanki]